MDDRSFERFGGWCAAGAGLASLAFALRAAYVGFVLPNFGMVRTIVSLSSDPVAGAMMAAQGLLTTTAILALFWRLRSAGRVWSLWGGGLGFVGAVMGAAHGVYTMVAGPALLAQWHSADEARQAATSVVSYLPTAIDPRGLGSLLLVGLSVFVASRLALADEAAPQDRRRGFAGIGLLGAAYATALVLLFILGLIGMPAPRAVLGGLTFGLLGPAFWWHTGRMLLAGVPPRAVPRLSLS